MLFKDFIIYGYIGLIILMMYFISKRGKLYVFSPIVVVYLKFLMADVLPYLITPKNIIPQNITYVLVSASIINIIFILIFRKDLFCAVTIDDINCVPRIIENRHRMIVIFAILLLVAGISTGMISMMMSGADVENYRMTSDIGMGFIRVIPALGIPILLLMDFFTANSYSKTKIVLITISCALLIFITTAARNSILAYIGVIFIWFCLRKRPFKWWEYIGIYYVAQPVVGTFLQLLRGGRLGRGIELFDNFLNYQLMVFNANTIKLMSNINEHNLLNGESYFYSLVKIIPRFLWEDKPVAIDYTYKKLVGYDFDGGGIFTTITNEMYMNFGNYYVISYSLFLFLVHLLYRQLIKLDVSTYTKTIISVFLLLYIHPRTIIESTEVLILFLFICYCFNQKWKVF